MKKKYLTIKTSFFPLLTPEELNSWKKLINKGYEIKEVSMRPIVDNLTLEADSLLTFILEKK